MAGLPTLRDACTSLLAAPLVVFLVSCEGPRLPASDDGIDFGEGDWGDDDSPGDGDSMGDGDATDDATGDGDGDDTSCAAVVEDLVVRDDTEPESVECVRWVLGDLTIGPTTALVDLQMLANLREVGGTMYLFGNLSLNTLAGLEQLERVSWLHVRRNHNLSSLHGLDSLAVVDHVTVANNAGMTSLAGLPEGLAPAKLEVRDNDLLASLDGLPPFVAPAAGEAIHVEIADNPSLIDLGGLSDCCSAQALSLTLQRNDALDDLHGLEGFTRLESLRLYDNQNLVELDGVDNLAELQTLDIDYDHCTAGGASLVDLAGLTGLVSVDVVQIQWVDTLTNLDGLGGIDAMSKLLVRNNEALPWGEVLELVSQSSPAVVDACGGVGGPECAPEPCPMY